MSHEIVMTEQLTAYFQFVLPSGKLGTLMLCRHLEVRFRRKSSMTDFKHRISSLTLMHSEITALFNTFKHVVCHATTATYSVLSPVVVILIFL